MSVLGLRTNNHLADGVTVNIAGFQVKPLSRQPRVQLPVEEVFFLGFFLILDLGGV
jgi:hypothetical protein